MQSDPISLAVFQMSKIQLTIECLPAAADDIAAGLAEVADDEVMRAEKDNLDGGLQTVLLVAQTAAPFFATLLPILALHLQRSQVTRLKVKRPDGTEFEIANPTKEQIEKYDVD